MTAARALVVHSVPGPDVATFGLWFVSGDPWDTALLQSLANACADAWTLSSYFTTHVSTTVQFQYVECQEFHTVPPNPKLVPDSGFVRSVNDQQLGGGGTDFLPAQTALVATLRTAEPGRSKRGRVFVIPPLEADAAQQVVTAAAAAACKTAVDDVIAAGEAVGTLTSAVVFSRLLNTTEAITSTEVSRFLRTQRRRATTRRF